MASSTAGKGKDFQPRQSTVHKEEEIKAFKEFSKALDIKMAGTSSNKKRDFQLRKFTVHQEEVKASKDILSDKNLQTLVASKLGTEWEQLMVNLGLTIQEVQQIKMDNPYNTVTQVTKCLIKWRDKPNKPEKNRLEELYGALHECNRQDLVEILKQNAKELQKRYEEASLRQTNTRVRKTGAGKSSVGKAMFLSDGPTDFQRFGLKESVRDTDTRLVIVGKTGTGKSSVGNTIFQQDGSRANLFQTDFSTDSVTSKCQGYRGRVSGQYYYVVDTPGIFDTRESMKATRQEIAKSVSLTTPGPHCFLLTIRLDNKFTEEEVMSVRNVKEIFGTGIDKYTVILYTRKDQLVREEKSFEQYLLQASPQFKKILQDCGNRYVLVDSLANGRELEAQTKEILKQVSMVIDKNNGKYYVSEAINIPERILLKEILEESERRKHANMQLDIKVFVNEQREQILNESGSVWKLIWQALKSFFCKIFG